MQKNRGFVIALLGAESTGKTTLALALRDALLHRAAAEGSATDALKTPRVDAGRAPFSIAVSIAVVPEYLREFCDAHGRTPRQDEQAAIAAEQTRRIDAAAADNDIVIADTTALMIAVYSDHVFGDKSLYATAEAAQARFDATLLTALDLAWQADGLQRDGPHVRAPVDSLVRASLDRAGCTYSIVFGTGAERVESALVCVNRGIASATPLASASASASASEPAHESVDAKVRWQWHCERCGEADCERHELPRRG